MGSKRLSTLVAASQIQIACARAKVYFIQLVHARTEAGTGGRLLLAPCCLRLAVAGETKGVESAPTEAEKTNISLSNQVIVNPDHGRDYFSSHGVPELEKRMRITHALLIGQVVFSTLISAAILGQIGFFGVYKLRIRRCLIRRGFLSDPGQWTLQEDESEAADADLVSSRHRGGALSRRTMRLCEVSEGNKK